MRHLQISGRWSSCRNDVTVSTFYFGPEMNMNRIGNCLVTKPIVPFVISKIHNVWAQVIVVTSVGIGADNVIFCNNLEFNVFFRVFHKRLNRSSLFAPCS